MKREQSIFAVRQEDNNADALNKAWQKHTVIVRGNPVRVYEGEKFKRKS